MAENSPIPLLLIRAHILSALKNGVERNISELVNFVHNSIIDYDAEMTVSVEESKLYQVILDMVESGSLVLNEGNVSRNINYVKNIEDPNYKPYTAIINNQLADTVSYDGSILVLTANTEDYTVNYRALGLNEGDYTVVELVPEPNNPYDSNAVCIMKNDKVLGYLDRTAAREYHRIIVRENTNGKKVIANALVQSSPYIPGIYYLDIRLR
jgi:hypothetical protein